MLNNFIQDYTIDYVEIYTQMAKTLAYWHAKALGFKVVAYSNNETGSFGISSYVLKSHNIQLVLTSSYPFNQSVSSNIEINSFIAQNYCGVKRFALKTDSVKELFEKSIANGAIPIKFPSTVKDEFGFIEEASIKLYDQSEITFINRNSYNGIFKPGYVEKKQKIDDYKGLLTDVDHIASEVRINEINYWTDYLTKAIGTELVQSIKKSLENKTGIVLNINQSVDKKLTLVMAEPETYVEKTKTQQNVDSYGPGIHHLAFSTDDIISTIKKFSENEVEFVSFPAAYYQLLRENKDFTGFDIDELEKYGILIDKEDNTYLLQKFIKPISDRPFFFYEIVQRVNGYNGFALKNINVLKKAEELQIMKTDNK